MSDEDEVARIKGAYPAEFTHGARTAFLRGEAASSDHPARFKTWPLDRRKAWLAGFDHGLATRAAAKKDGAHP